MSVHVLSWVLRHSDETLGRRLVLIVLADHAKEDGTSSWPSVNTIAREARMTRRPVQAALRQLEASGAITPTGTSRQGTTIYTIEMGGAESAQGGADATREGALEKRGRGAAAAPEPSLEPSETLAPAEPARARDLVWDELEHRFGPVAPRTNAHAKRNKAVADLKRAGATPETIAAAAAAWPRTFEATLTDVALATHYPQLVHKRASAAPAPSASEVVDLPEISDEERAANLERLAALTSGIGRSAA